MSEFGKIEKHIASLLVRHPKIKNRLKLAYQKINHTVYRKPYTFKLAQGVYMKRLLESKALSDFWGYYDSSLELATGIKAFLDWHRYDRS